MKALPVTRSLFSQTHIAEWVAEHYSLPAPVKCQLLQAGDHDDYLICADSKQFILRIYGEKYWLNTDEAYRFEIAWLRYLQEKRSPVSHLIPRKDGYFLGYIEAPEGPRHSILRCFAEGVSGPLNGKRAFLLGREIARIHLISAKFETTHKRAPLDLHFLLDEPVLAIKQHLDARYTEEQQRLDELAAQLKEKVLSLLSFKEAEWGMIGGNFNGFNQHFVGNDQLTLWDFDLCGYGWRAYDLGVFRWMQFSDVRTGAHALEAFLKGNFFKWKRFLSGYQSIRPLSGAELEAIPLFVQIRQIWHMGACVKSPNPLMSMNDRAWENSFNRLLKPFQ